MELDKVIVKFIEDNGRRISKTILKKNKSEELSLAERESYYEAISD